MNLRSAISIAYDIPPTRVVMDDPIGNTRYDFLLTVPKESAALLDQFFQQALESTFKLRVRRETRETDVYVLTTSDKQPPALRPSSASGMTSMSRGKLTGMGISIDELARMLEGIVERPAVDETRLADKYDVEFTWDEDKPESLTAAVRERLGLELREARRPVEMLIIETAPPAPRPSAEKPGAPPK